MISYQKWRDRRDWFSVSWRVMKMNDTFRKWCESKEDVPVGVTSMYEHFFSTRSVWGLKLETWKSTNPLGSYHNICFDFMHLDMQSLRMKRHQKRLRKRNQPRRKRRRKIVLETSWNMICFCMIMINTSYLKWIRFYLVCVFIFCCKKKWVQLGMVGFLVLPMFFRAHAFCVREGSRVRHQILSKTQGSKLHGWIGENEPICKLDVGFLVPVLP